MSETVVLDSSNLAAIIADATSEPLEAPAKPAEPAKPVEVAKPVETVKTPEDAHDGLTEAEKKTYTESMKKSIAWRHGKMKEAQEQAQREKQGRLAAEERAAAAERERDAAKAQQPRVETKGPPKAQDFQSQEEYVAARVKWEVGEELRKEREQRQQAAEQADRDRVVAAAGERVRKAAELVPDFAEVTEAADVTVPLFLSGAMMESELFAELGYHFAKHPDQLERITKLPPASALVALGKIESKLTPFGPAPASAEQPEVKANGASKPSTDTDGNPSRPRASVPVIQPLNARGAPEVETVESTPTKEIANLERRRGVSLTKRARH